MEGWHPLKALLQIQLASDAQAVLHLPYILATLRADDLLPSEHTQKWTTRLNSLILSKDGSARWSGLSIALKSATLSQNMMLECAQTWVGAALPLLSKNEPFPTLKAAIRLLRRIFTGATEVPEFQRQVSTPNIPKFSQALITLGEKTQSDELRILCLDTLSQLIPLYPTLHRALQNALTKLTLKFLNGSAPKPMSSEILSSASKLYSLLHYTGGKVGAAAQWKKSMDDTIAFAWGSLVNTRTTFPASGTSEVGALHNGPQDDPVLNIPLHLDRLRAAVKVLCDLLQASNPRPVVLPIGSLVRLCVALIRCTADEKIAGHVDPLVHSLEVSIIPRIHALGCDLVNTLSICSKQHLTPHMSQLLFYVVLQLEKKYPPDQHLPFIQASIALVQNCAPPHDPLIHSRLTRALLPSITNLLAPQAEVSRESEHNTNNGTRSKKGKKRARGYEGDEVFNVNRLVICPTNEDGEVVLATLELLKVILRNGVVAPAVQSIATRVVLAIHMALPQMPPAHLSPDATLHGTVTESVSRICSELVSGTASTMSKSLGLVIGTSMQNSTLSNVTRELELLVHPRAPPLVRSLPHVEMLSLYRVEESQEEQETRLAVQIGIPGELMTAAPEDITMQSISTSNSSRTHNVFPTHMPSNSVPAALIQNPAPMTISVAPTQVPQIVEPVVDRPAPINVPVVPSTNTTTATLVKPGTPSLPQVKSMVPPPSSDLLPRSTNTSSMNSISTPQVVAAGSSTMAVDDEDEDEPMPTIDMDSDSEAE
ncbi:hypothetical protein QCA50_000414 [Cerrena zonata]|uniref:Pre-rRNA-processing protein RIX1 n=1 Tax=Cerrena zonata TaxID=2478898 RepID=A0AAW0GUJ7_9APHY